MSFEVTIQSEQHAATVLRAIEADMREDLRAGKKFVVSVKKETRRNSQNGHYHSLIGQIAAQALIGGHKFDAGDAKRILISAFRMDTKDDPVLSKEWSKFGQFKLAPGLRGELVALGEQSREFTVPLGYAFVTWLECFAAENGVRFKVPDSWQQEPGR